MIFVCSKRQLYFWLAFSLAVLAVFFVSAYASVAQEVNEPRDIYDRDKAIQIASEKGGPGGCNSEETCNAVCNSPDNFEMCMDWAKENGVISSDNYDKHIGFAQKGGPGGCKTPETCKSYCEEESNFDQCLEFGEQQGLISKEQAERAKKTGPGGCRTQKDCQAFCEQPQNQDACIEHAVSEGFMTQAEAQRIKEFRSRAEEFRKKADEFRKQTDEFKRPEVKRMIPVSIKIKPERFWRRKGKMLIII